ncbi:LLM class flavin-dependent oxidoreductase [Nonomuraea sp. NPDC026600]|uniref:LLM class flavin-dependent oxidoreductase n=1 Tax=Nonomuraea sp. NPDC026600 TaxID=3155363 RepID=UPI0033C6E1A8
MKRSLAVAVSSFTALENAGRLAEACGLDRVWTTELRGRDAFVRALHVAAVTERIEVGTGIAYAFTRHPMAMAAAAMEGFAACSGRLTVGIGAGTAHTRGEFGLDFDHPAPRLGEYAALMRAALDADGDLRFHGRFYDVTMPGFAFGHPRPLRAGVKVYGSGLNPTALRALARTCDGIALHPFGHVPGYLNGVVRPTIGRAAADRDGEPEIAAWLIACALDDAREARELAKAQIALYAAQPGFAPYFEHTPWAGAAERICSSAWPADGVPSWRAIGAALVPDDMLDGLAIAGAPGDVALGIAGKEAELARSGVSEITLQIPGIALAPQDAEGVLTGLIHAAAR